MRYGCVGFKQAALLLGIWLYCCLSASQAAPANVGAEPVRIGAAFSLSGRTGDNDRLSVQVIAKLIQQQNAKGGIAGRPLQLIELDMASRVANAPVVARQAIEAGVIAVLGANVSSQTAALAPYLQLAGIPLISPASSMDNLSALGDHVFRINFTDSDQAGVMALFAKQQLNAGTAVLVTDVSQKFSQHVSAAFQRAYQELGGQVLLNQEIIQHTVDFRLLLKQVATAQPQVLILTLYGLEAGALLRQMDEMGLKIPVLCAEGCGTDVGKLRRSPPYQFYHVSHWHASLATEPAFNAIAAEMSPQHLGAASLAYDATMLLLHSLTRCQASSRQALWQALQQPWQGITGFYHFARQRDPIKQVLILRRTPDGPELTAAVWPERADRSQRGNMLEQKR